MKKEQFTVTGMSCAACSARVEKAVSQIDGVNVCQVNLLTNSMTVEGTASAEIIINAVEKAGYGASIKGQTSTKTPDEDNAFRALRNRLISSLLFLFILMYISMGHNMWGWPLPSFLEGNHIANGLIQLLLTIIVMLINRQFFINGIKGIVNKSPNMDTLVALGSGAGFVYSLYVLFAMTATHSGGTHLLHDLYFEGSAMILALITVGKMLEAHSKGKTTNAIKGLMALSSPAATVIRNGEEIIIPPEEIIKGDIFIVKTGESIPADGIIIEGTCTVNESALTGESIPKDKAVGDTVSTATVNQSGYIKCEARKVGEDTLLSQIIKMVSDASATKAPVAKAADKVSGVFVPIVIGIAVITLIIWLIAGETMGFALSRAISVLVISCPCALGLATPVAIMVGNGVGARNGILFKTAIALETTGKITTVALDKTGTITAGTPKVTDVIPYENVTESELVALAYSLEKMSSHPLATAIVEFTANTDALDISDFKEHSGHGLSAILNNTEIRGGNEKFVTEISPLPDTAKATASQLAQRGKTPLFFVKQGQFMGIIAVADTVKPDSPKAIKELQNMGINVVMLTGDNERTAKAIKEETGVDRVFAEVLPDEKANIIKDLKADGGVAMVGDGINDAPALTVADIGIAVGRGTDIAIDAADIVLMKDTLTDVCAAIRLSRQTLKNIYENLFWAFIYNVIGIPIAAGVLIPFFGIKLNPMFAAAAMSLSSFFVVTNALRLNFAKIYSNKKDRKNKKENKTMEKTLKVNGMMCMHCEAHVKKALEELDGVVEATASHEAGTVTVKLSKDIPTDVLKNVIEGQGYTVTD